MPGRTLEFLERNEVRLLLLGGKGGVGKTTCAAAAALHLAEQHPREQYQLVSTDPAHSLRDSFAGAPLPANLDLLEIDAGAGFAAFKQAHAGHLKSIAQRGTFLDDDDINGLLELSLPGMVEVVAFRRICSLVEACDKACIIVDTAPTGHTLRFLGLRDVFRMWLETLDAMLAKHRYMVKLYRGFYHQDETDLFLKELDDAAEQLASVLCDPCRCCFVPITLAEPVVTAETGRLVRELEKLKIPISHILVNRVHPATENGSACRYLRRTQERELDEMQRAFPSYPLWCVPLYDREVRGREQLTRFWEGVKSVDSLLPGATGKACVRTDAGPAPKVDHPFALPSRDVRLLLFAGKGGVGKTTLASATALRLTQCEPSRHVLLFSTDPAHSLSDCLDTPVGPQGMRVSPRLAAVEIDANAELEELKADYGEEVEGFFNSMTSGAHLDVAFDRDVIERVMNLSPPGLDEIMTVAHAMRLLEEGAYDLVILDTAPTGHLIRLLETPRLIQEWLRFLFDLFLKYKKVLRLPKICQRMVELSKRTQSLQSLLKDHRRGRVHAVAVPTRMALAETDDLFLACRQAGIHVSSLFLNLVTPVQSCALCRTMAREEATVRDEFEKSFRDVEQAVVYRDGDLRGQARLSALGRALYSD